MNKTSELTVQFEEKTLDIKVSPRATKELKQRDVPLFVEMELLFSSMTCKKLRFNNANSISNCISVNKQLSVSFHPVMNERSSKDDSNEPTTTDFPASRRSRFIPHWLTIDFYKGEWRGEFGYLLEADNVCW